MFVPDRSYPFTRLGRAQLLTLNTWRWATVKLEREIRPDDILEQVALHATVATLRNLDDPLQLFTRHAQAHPEFELIRSLAPGDCTYESLPHDILDAAFLLRWNELTIKPGHTQSAGSEGSQRGHHPEPESGPS